MLRIDKQQVVNGTVVYGDDGSDHLFYVLANTIRFEVDEQGRPRLKFLKYRHPLTISEKRGGGYCLFDLALTVPNDRLARIKKMLQEQVNRQYSQMGRPAPEVRVEMIPATRWSANLMIDEVNSALIENFWCQGKHVVYGRYVTSLAVELTPQGASVFEQAIAVQQEGIKTTYDLYFLTRMPAVNVTFSFLAGRYYEFQRSTGFITDFRQEEKIRESIRRSNAGTINVAWMNITNPDLRNQIQAWAQRTLEDAIIRQLQLQHQNDDWSRQVAALYKETERGVVQKTLANNMLEVIEMMTSFSRSYNENDIIEWNVTVQANTPSITMLKDHNGNPIRWADYAQTIDLNELIPKQLNIQIRVNADFAGPLIDYIDVKLDYEGDKRSYIFKNPNEVQQFNSLVKNNNRTYSYSYEVQHKGPKAKFVSKSIKTDEPMLMINISN